MRRRTLTVGSLARVTTSGMGLAGKRSCDKESDSESEIFLQRAPVSRSPESKQPCCRDSFLLKHLAKSKCHTWSSHKAATNLNSFPTPYHLDYAHWDDKAGF